MRECKDCIHYQVCNWQVNAFNCFFYKAPTEGARDYIEREPLLEFAKKYQGDTFSFPLLMRAIKDAPTVDVVPKNEWISVGERLPEDVYGKDRTKITVLVCSESGRVSTASRQRQFKFNSTKLEWEKLDAFAWSNSKRVTHWMPLPEAPKGGE